jgi:large subunit ribosomal protein L9
MEVILLKNVENLGSLGDKVSVKGGYGRNFLIPTGSAVPATAANQAAFEERRAELEKEAAEAVSQAETRKTAIEALSIVIPVKSGEEGRLFGSVGAADIADAASAAGAAVDKKEVRLTQGPLRVVGEYEIQIHLYTGVDAVLKLEVVPE